MRWALCALASVLKLAIFVCGRAWHPLIPHSALEQASTPKSTAPTPESMLTQSARPRALEVGVTCTQRWAIRGALYSGTGPAL